ncbi:hypothetical protein [Bradyrhizobium sp.]|uniref:hypothetical protein n=1 Tax=Bradyrhizobium sp. TaxID=376 RepID=UPI001ED02870|nr:hypothetical protein [Bradyrhizobium sp.]MBV8688443.1 hypothetical protein [Alphaproteobacteria bacterium]MBV9373063.1 hypothetical protein [Alphaproteobacteria bacterium]MBV9979115.1 hypothetical protein [Bradyrhizobium sp.]
MTYLAAAIFFTLVLLASMVALHMEVRRHWVQIVLALRGEWHGVPHYRIAPVRRVPTVRPSVRPAPTPAVSIYERLHQLAAS